MAQIPRRRPYVSRCRATRALWWAHRLEKLAHEAAAAKSKKKNSKEAPEFRDTPRKEPKTQLGPPTKVFCFPGSYQDAYRSTSGENTPQSAGHHRSRSPPKAKKAWGDSPSHYKNGITRNKESLSPDTRSRLKKSESPAKRGSKCKDSPAKKPSRERSSPDKKSKKEDSGPAKKSSNSNQNNNDSSSNKNDESSTLTKESGKAVVDSWLKKGPSAPTQLFGARESAATAAPKAPFEPGQRQSQGASDSSKSKSSASSVVPPGPVQGKGPAAGANPYAKLDSTASAKANPYAQLSAAQAKSNPYTGKSAAPVGPGQAGFNPYAQKTMGCNQSKQADATAKPIGITPDVGAAAGAGAIKPGAAAKPKAKQFSWDQKKKINKMDYMVMDKENETITRENLELNQFVIDGCKNCDIFVLSATATVSVDYCENCRIFLGPIESSVFFRNCTNCTFVVVCQQFRSRDCTDCKTSLFCQTDPIIETSTNMEFSCFCLSYFSLRGHLDAAKINPWSNKWFKIFDFNPREDGKLNYSLVQPYNGSGEKSMKEGLLDFGKCTNKEFSKEVEESLDGSSSLPCAIPLTLGPLGTPENLSSDPNDRVIALFLDRNSVDDFLSTVKEKYTIVQSRVLALDKSRVQRLASVFGKEKSKELDADPRLHLTEVIGVDVNSKGLLGLAEKEGGSGDLKGKMWTAKKEEAGAVADTFFVAIKDDEEMANKIK